MSNQNYTISEAANILGVSAVTLRLWERQGKITSSRTAGGQRRYTPGDLEVIRQMPHSRSAALIPEVSIPKFQFQLSSSQKRVLFGSLIALIISLLGFMAARSLPAGRQALISSLQSLFSKPSAASIVNQLKGAVLASQTVLEDLRFTVNVPALFNQDITAPNILYGLTAGDNITLTAGQTPTISAASTPTFKSFKVGSDTVSAASSTDTFTFAGSGDVSLSLNTTGKKLTITSSVDVTKGGFTDDGTIVRLTTAGDIVAIGAASGAAKLNINTDENRDLITASQSGNLVFKLTNTGLLNLAATGFGAGLKLQNNSALFSGSGAPSDSSGTAGDYYFRTDGTTGNTSLYYKVSGSWISAGGGSLQVAYNSDTDGSDAIIALTSVDDSLIFRNPSSAGTDSGYVLAIDQLASGAGIEMNGSTIVNIGNAGTDFTASGGLTLATPLLPTSGGTGIGSYTTGDILYASTANTLAKLGIGGASQVLIVSGGIPAWSSTAGGGSGSGTFGWWQRNSGVLSPTNITDDLIIGATATSSALFQVAGTTGNITSSTGSNTFGGDLAVNGGDLTTTAATFNLATSATTINIAATSGITTVNNSAVITGDLGINGGDLTSSAASFNLLQSAVTTIYFGGAATTLSIGASTGTTTINNPLTAAGVFTGRSSATISGALTLYGTPTLASTAMQTLTLGGSTTGNLVLDSGSAIVNLPDLTVSRVVFTDASGNLTSLATSSVLAASISNETGSGALVFADSPSLTSPSFSTIVNTGTLTLPTATDTLVGRATTDTLTNKTLSTGSTWQGNTIADDYGGTGQSTYTTGDILYSSATNTLAKLGIGTTNYVLSVSGGIPAWTDSASLADSTWQRLLGVVSPRNITDDLGIGGTATSSAKFQVFGTTGNATSAGNLTFSTAATIATTAMQSLTLGDASTGNIVTAKNISATGTLTGLTGLTVASGTVSLPAGEIGNTELANSSITVAATAGTGLSVSGSPVSLGGTVTLSGIDASTTVKGVASFNSTNFSVSSGAVNTIQNIAAASSPTFTGLTLSGLNTAGAVVFTDTSGVLGKTAQGISGQVLTSGGTGTPTWVDSATLADSTWQRNLGAVSPLNITDDLLIGGISTASATFRVNRATGLITTASVNSASIVDASVANADLVNSAVTITAGTGLSGGGAVSLGSSISISNSGVTSATGTTNQVNVSASTGAVTFSLPQDIHTIANPTFNALTLNSSATVSGGLVLYGTPTISTTAMQSLTLGDASTGNIVTAKNISATGTLTGLTGLTVASGTVSLPAGEIGSAELANTAVTAATYGASGATVPTFTVDAQGRLTAAGSYTISGLTTSNLSASAGILNTQLANSAVTVTAGTGLSGGGSVSLGSSVTLSLPTVTTALGGTNITTYTTGDILYSSATNTLAKLGIGGANQVLAVSSGIPGWVDSSSLADSTWQRLLGVVSPRNITDDLSIGGTATASAKFQVFGLTGNATSAGNLTFSTAATIATTAMQTLTLGNASTGIVDIAGSKLRAAAFQFTTGASSGYVLTSDGSGNSSWTNIGTDAAAGPWTLSGGVTFPDVATYNVLVGSATSADGIAPLTVTGAETGKALVILNETGDQNILTASASGTTRYIFDRSGNISLTAGSDIRPLTDSTTALNIANAAGTDFVTFDTTNSRVGIGTTGPGATLQLTGTSVGFKLTGGNTPFMSMDTLTGGYNLRMDITDSTGLARFGSTNATPVSLMTNSANVIYMTTAGNVGIGTTGPTAKLEVIGKIWAHGNDLVTDSRVEVGSIGTLGTPSIFLGTDANTGIWFPTADNLGFVTGGTEVIRINQGNVGIGTTGPATPLDVSSGGIVSLTLRRNSAAGENALNILGGAGSGHYNWKIGKSVTVGNALEFIPSTAADGTTFSTPNMVILQNGNVGINDTTPDALFDIDSAATTTNVSGILATAITTGNIFDLSSTSTAATSSDLIQGDHTATYTAATTVSGNLLDLSRALTINLAATTLTVSGAVASITDNCTVTAGTCTSTADVLNITQSYASNSGAALNVTTAGTGLALRINDDGTLTDTTAFVIDSSGQVGIGTTGPGALLHLVGSDTPVIRSKVTTTASGNFYTGIRFGTSSGDDIGTFSVTSSNYATSGIYQPNLVVFESFDPSPGIAFVARKSTGFLQFITGGFATTNERMRIDSSGNVGIGTTGPSQKLHIRGSDPSIRLEDTDVGGSDAVYFANVNGRLYLGSSSGTTGRKFSIDIGTPDDAVFINNLGNVGIGDTTPDALLDLDSAATTTNVSGILATAITTGNIFDVSSTSTAATSSDLIQGDHTATYTAATTVSGNLLDLSRALTINLAATTLTVSGAVASITDNCTVTAGTCTSTADVLNITQSYASNSGAALNVTTAGTGLALRVNDDGTLTDTTAFVIDSSGQVGIGTTGPTFALTVKTSDFGNGIQLQQNGTVGDIEMYSGSNGGLYLMRNAAGTSVISLDARGTNNSYINNGGNVGIGTTGPTNKLHVLGTTRIQSGQDAGSLIIGADNSATTLTDATDKAARVGVAHYTNAEEPFATWVGSSGSTTNSIDFGGGTSVMNAATLLKFYTAANTTTLTGTERVRIDSTGNVGIGTVSPASKLDVTTTALGTTQTNTSGLALVNTTAAAAGLQQISPALRWRGFGWKTDVTAASQPIDFRASVVPVQGAAAPTGYLAFESAVNDGAYSATLALTDSGRVGIGTTGPTHLLQVNGTARVNQLNIGVSAAGTREFNMVGGGRLQWQTAAGVEAGYIVGSNAATGDLQLFTSGNQNITLNAGSGNVLVSGTGNVGIGDTTPDALLDLDSAATTTNVSGILATAITTGNIFDISSTSTAATSSDLIQGDHTATYTTAQTVSGNLLDLSRALTINAAATTLTVSGSVASITDNCTVTAGTCTSTADVLNITQSYASNSGAALNVTTAGTGLALRVNDDGTLTDTTAFVIDSSGQVGIGTTGPSQKLHISSTGATTAMAVTNSSGTGYFGASGTDTYAQILSNGFKFYASDGSTPLVTILNAGNVGIGDISPAATLTVGSGDLFQVAGATGNITTAGDIAINGGDITSSATTFNLVNATVTTLNIGGAATTLSLGSSSGTTTVNNSATVTGDIAINGGDLTSSATTFNLLQSTVTTLNLGGASTTLSIGASTGTTTVNNALTVSGTLTSNGTLTVNSDVITLGNAITDAITFTARVAADSDLVPIGTAGTNDLGSSSLPWDNVYADNIRSATYTSPVADSATAVGFTFDTTNTLATQGAKILSAKTGGTEKFYIDKDGNLYTAGTILSGNGQGQLMTNKSGGTVAVRGLVIIDTSNNSAFTTTTTAYAKTGFGVVTGVGLGVTNDANGDGVCNANDICMIAVGGEVNVTATNASTAAKGDYLFTSATAGSAVASAKQFDGLIGIVSGTANAASGYLKMIFKVQPQVTAAASIDKGSKHNEYWLYANKYSSVGEGADVNANLLTRGLSFDTLSDSTKIDTANTTASYTSQVAGGLLGGGRAGLIGGQTLATSTTDNAGNTYLGSNTVNKTFLYDRTRDSAPQVQVELGLDPNWYNGVTLAVATSSAQFSQNSVIVKNPNLSTTYNGSAVKATGAYTSNAKTIYITIKSPTTFDWTDYNGQAATGTTITPGTAQTLGGTGVSAKFTDARYNTGDVFKIASWFVEPSSSTRGAKAAFPERSTIIATASSVDIIDADTQKLWMRFSQGTNFALGVDANNDPNSVNMLNGKMYVATNGSAATGLYGLDFVHDAAFKQNATDWRLSDSNLAQRNGTNTYNVLNTSNILVNITANDVSASVICTGNAAQPSADTLSGRCLTPKTFVGVATGAGISLINETDSSVVNASDTSAFTNIAMAYNSGSATYNSSMYGAKASSTINVYTNLSALAASFATTATYSTTVNPAPAATAVTINSLQATAGTSTVDMKSNTIYVGTAAGAGVIQENQATFASGSVKYYTKDYISEEMVGNIRGMWPLSANGAISMSDASVKADTLTNNATATFVTGVRGGGVSFNGTTQYLSCTDAACGGTSKLDFGATTDLSYGAWFKTTVGVSRMIMMKGNTTGANTNYSLYIKSTDFIEAHIADGTDEANAASSLTYLDGQWYFAVAVHDNTNLKLYVDGILVRSASSTAIDAIDSTDEFRIGANTANSQYFSGSIDEPFVTAKALSAAEVKHMYEVGYRALQSHATTLGGGGADLNQQLGFISTGTNVVGDAKVDYNNQFMYVGTNSTTLGALSKIDLNSDTNLKTYNSSANVPAGGALLIDEDTKSLAVGYNLEAVGSAASGVKTMGVDSNATATSGNFIGKTTTTAESFTQAYLWAQYTLDSSDASNTVTVSASNDGGTNYYTCNLTNTDTSQTPTEYEYFCQFNAAGSSLKTKFALARGSTKTNTYVTRYGIAWIGSDAIGGQAGGNGLYTNNNASVANGSFIDVAHNQNSNDLVSNGWVYNTNTSKWEQIDDKTQEEATGGTITYSGGYTIHTFTSSGTFTPPGTGDVEYLVVAGGGGGGRIGGGGGAGGFRTATGFAVTAQGYTTTVGAGGAGSTDITVKGSNGSDSVFSTITSTGGGGGGSNTTNITGAAGGSGGGGGSTGGGTPSGGAGTASQGNDGGAGLVQATAYPGGGGGGASAIGGAGSGSTAGSGGAGTASSISGSSVTYAGGGGGGSQGGTAGSGGAGGGGAGTNNNSTATNGTANTGGGGGGGGWTSGSGGIGGTGGSGIVIVRYLTNSLSVFKIQQQDANTVRLYNYSGAAQNLRLDVITGGLGRNAGTVSLAPAAADVDAQDSVNSIWINKTGLNGNILKLQKSGTDILSLSQRGGDAALILDQRLSGDIFTASASGTTRMVLTNAGNLGIGTTGPSSLLEASTTSGGSIIGQFTAVDASAFGPITSLYHDSSSPAASDEVGTLQFYSKDSVGTKTNYAQILARITDPTNTSEDGELEFYTMKAGTVTEQMTIDSTGNVGIGTTGPGQKLSVSGGHIAVTNASVTDRGLDTTLSGARTTGSYGYVLANTSTSSTASIDKYGLYVDSSGTWNGTSANNYGVYVAPSGGTTDWGLYVTGEDKNYFSGNVGIGTTGPVTLLHLKSATVATSLRIEGGTEANVLQIQSDNDGGFIRMLSNEPLYFQTNSLNRMTILAGGNVGIGTTSPDSIKLDVEDDIEVGTGTTGCVRDADNTTIAGTCSSDIRLKTNIKSLGNVLEKYVQLNPVTFDWIDGTNLTPNYGLIAQEAENIMPELVETGDDGYKRVRYDTSLHMLSLQAIKELNTRDKEQQEQIASISARLQSLEVSADGGQAELGQMKYTSPLPSPKLGEGDPLAEGEVWLYATSSGKLTSIFDVQVPSLTVTGKLQVGLLSFDDLAASISSLTGEITIKGDLAITGKLNVLGDSTGQATISAGLTTITVSSSAVTSASKVFTSPRTATGKQPLIITDLIPKESFTVIIESAYSSDILFDWWLIN